MSQNKAQKADYRIHMRVTGEIRVRLDELEQLLDTRSKTEVIRRSILFFHAVISQIAEGGRFVLYDAEGRPRTLIP